MEAEKGKTMSESYENDSRAPVANWREYLVGTREAFGVYAWVWRTFVTPETRRHIAWLFAAQVLRVTLILLDMWFLKDAIDAALARKGSELVQAFCCLLVANVGGRLAQAWGDRRRERALADIWRRVDVDSTRIALEKSLGQHAQESILLSPASLDKGRGRTVDMAKMLISDGISASVELTLAFAGLWLISPFGGAVMTGLLAVYLLFLVYVNHRVLVECTPIDLEFRILNHYRMERLESIERVKSNGKEREEVERIDARFGEITRKDVAFWLWCIDVNAVRGVIAVLVQTSLIGFALHHVWEGAWTVGFLFPFVQWVRRAGENLWRIADLEHHMNWNLSSVRSFRRALSLVPDVTDAPDALPVRAGEPVRVELRDVGHAYREKTAGKGASPHVLRNVSLTVDPGEKVALIGPSGAGKSTVMRALLRWMDVQSGQILVNGTDLRQLALSSWLHAVGYIAQRSHVFDASVRDNLLYGLAPDVRAKVTDARLWEVMRMLRIDFGSRLTHGLETKVGRDGIQLSGGQAQRLMIGAAVLKGTRFLLVDEATSSLDSTTEKAVQEGLAAILGPDVSALIIAHRLSTIADCDRIVVLRPAEEAGDEPQVEAVGTFEELYETSPTFRRLAADQGLLLGTQIAA